MSKFVAIWRQSGGCDYTIGCGIAVEHLEAESILHAKVEILAKIQDPEQLSDESADSIKSIHIFETGDHCRLTPADWAFARKERIDAARTNKTEAKERAELERLKKKYG